MKYVIGTRGSKLALIQADFVREKLEETYPDDTFEIKVIKTQGDRIQDKPLDAIGGKGLFVQEIEDQILSGEVHIGVHSMKDMPVNPEKGLIFTKPWKRENPRDALILREKKSMMELPLHAVIGTGSKRRKYQLLKMRPDLQVVNIRGNVDTRLRKMEEQKLDGIVLAAAGLIRMEMEDRITQYFEYDQMVPSPAQGVLAIEVKEDNEELIQKLDALANEETMFSVKAERTFLENIGGDCHSPVGAVCSKKEDGIYELHAMFGNEEGTNTGYTAVIGKDPETLAKMAVEEITNQMKGTVYLVGGGPGDPGLITVKGLECIQKADCIIYDRLSSPELLEEAKPSCRMIYVGKENHHHTMKQDDINVLLVNMAKRYKNVVRLKGGDVFVFGRGGEEGIVLKENNIPFEIVPGISSSIAGLAYAGIPITHRGVSTGFHVVTAHSRKDELAKLDFESMAKNLDTNVFLMGLSKLHDIMTRLMDAGMPKDTKAAVISHATTSKQKTCIGTIETIEEIVSNSSITSPALIVVGDVIDLRETLNFYEVKPLFGKNLLVPKIGNTTSRLTKLLRSEGASVDEVMVGKMEYLSQTFTKEDIQKVNWIILTSRNGVEAFFNNLLNSNLDVRCLGNVKFATIGKATSEALSKYGIKADLVPEEFNSSALIECMKMILKKDDIVWYPKAKNATDKMEDALKDWCNIVSIPVYENVSVDFTLSSDITSYDNILFTCGSSVKRLLSSCTNEEKEILDNTQACISIGPECSKTLHKEGIQNIQQAKQSSYESMEEIFK